MSSGVVRGGVQENNRGQSSVSKLITASSDVRTEPDTVQLLAENRMLSIKNNSAQPLRAILGIFSNLLSYIVNIFVMDRADMDDVKRVSLE